jgi:hypothetical protein
VAYSSRRWVCRVSLRSTGMTDTSRQWPTGPSSGKDSQTERTSCDSSHRRWASGAYQYASQVALCAPAASVNDPRSSTSGPSGPANKPASTPAPFAASSADAAWQPY